MTSSFKAALLAGLLSILSPSLCVAVGPEAHAPEEMIVTAINPVPINDERGHIEWEQKCTIPFGTKIERFANDDLQVIAVVRRIFNKPLSLGECPFATPFHVTKDTYIRMELNYLIAMRNNWQERLEKKKFEAKMYYISRDMEGEKLRVAILMDPEVKEACDGLEKADQNVLEEQLSVEAQKERARKRATLN